MASVREAGMGTHSMDGPSDMAWNPEGARCESGKVQGIIIIDKSCTRKRRHRAES
jgi:hypothetical protein